MHRSFGAAGRFWSLYICRGAVALETDVRGVLFEVGRRATALCELFQVGMRPVVSMPLCKLRETLFGRNPGMCASAVTVSYNMLSFLRGMCCWTGGGRVRFCGEVPGQQLVLRTRLRDLMCHAMIIAAMAGLQEYRRSRNTWAGVKLMRLPQSGRSIVRYTYDCERNCLIAGPKAGAVARTA